MRFGERGNKYMKITKQQRLQNFTIKKSAEIVGIRCSTARMILKKYEKEGIIFEPKISRKQEIESVQNQENQELNLNHQPSKIDQKLIQIGYPITFYYPYQNYNSFYCLSFL